MTVRADPDGSVLDRIKRTLVGLRMPRALEMIDATVRQLEPGASARSKRSRGCSPRSCRSARAGAMKTALVMARLSTIKTLAGFDFTFQPSLDRNRVLALAQLDFIDRHEVRPPARAARHRQEPPRDRARGRGGQGRPQRLLRHACRPRRRARQGRARGPAARQDPLLLPRRAPDRRSRSATCRSSRTAATCSSSWSTRATSALP